MSIRAKHLSSFALIITMGVAGCGDPDADREAIQSLDDLNVIDESNLNDIMLNFADPNQAVEYFKNSSLSNPDRADLKRGHAASLMRARRSEEAVLIFEQLDSAGEAKDGDRLLYAEALIQNNGWEEAQNQLNQIPPTIESYNRYRLEAMVADYRQDWEKSDAFYENAAGLTTRPAAVYNNWGISMLSRGNAQAAEEKFRRAISYDRDLFNAKNNLAISRAKRGNYELPILPMTAVEKAQLLHNMALQALRNGKTDIAAGLLEEAVDTHPQHFEAAVAKLETLTNSVQR